jgi:hypothetical protein
VGEHRLLKKGPLLFTTALLSFYPICMAEAATSSFEKSPLLSATSAPYGHLTPSLAESKRLGQTQSLPKSYRDLLSPASLLPSIEDLNTLESTLSRLENQLKTLYISKAKDPLNTPALSKAITNVENSISDLKKRITTAENALNSLKNAQFSLQTALNSLQTAETLLLTAQTAEQNAKDTLDQAKADKLAKEQAKASSDASLSQAQTTYNEAVTKKESSDASLTHQQEITAQALLTLNERQAEASTASQSLAEAEQTLQQAQQDYDTKLIPDPTWTAPTYQKENTRLVPYTEIQIVRTQVPTTIMIATGGVKAEVFNRQGYNNAPPLPTQNEVPIHTETVSTIDFNWGSGQVLNSGRNEDVIVRFTGNFLVPKDGWYQFYAPADDGTKLNIAGMEVIDDWYDKGGGGTISDPVFIRAGIFYPFTFHYYENGGGANVGLYTYSPQQGFSLVPSTWMGISAEQQTTYEEVITYEEVTKYREEIYYTTEPVLTEGTIQVRINEGGEATFVAPEGATFVSSNLRYEAIGNPTCGADISPRNLGGNIIQLVADNSIWGDPCGGQYKHITGTITYLGQPTAPLIKDPALIPALNSAQETLNDARSNLDAANSQLQTAAEYYNAELQKSQASQTLNEALSLEVISNNIITNVKQEEYNKASTDLDIATSNEASSQATYSSAQQATLEAQTLVDTSTQAKTDAEAAVQETKTLNEASFEAASGSSSRIQPLIDAVNEILNKEPEPKPEEGSTEIPAIIENLMDVDLNAVDPTELTPEQAVQLVEAALVAFETAVEGSPEYEQALDALYLAAEQDDIELPAELAAIPGLAGAVEVLNFLGNAGADMSPQVREESEKVVVATVIAAGAAIQAATGAATSAAVSASAPSGGSRRIGK